MLYAVKHLIGQALLPAARADILPYGQNETVVRYYVDQCGSAELSAFTAEICNTKQ